MSNLLKAIWHIVSNPFIDIKAYSAGRNRANSSGAALENYVQDLFAGSFALDESERNKRIATTFSYMGNQNNPPDLILREGDAIEVKKIQSPLASLALNSSYPKSVLFADNPMLTSACRSCEEWTKKDIIYVVGYTDDAVIKHLWFIYGDCFIADSSIYERIKTAISNGIHEIPDVAFSKTNELGKVKKVDPLGITDLRIRGMWHIDNPQKIFKHLNSDTKQAKFRVSCLMRLEKFNKFPERDRELLTNFVSDGYVISDVEIKNPNNPSQLMDAKFITFRMS